MVQIGHACLCGGSFVKLPTFSMRSNTMNKTATQLRVINHCLAGQESETIDQVPCLPHIPMYCPELISPTGLDCLIPLEH